MGIIMHGYSGPASVAGAHATSRLLNIQPVQIAEAEVSQHGPGCCG